MKAQTGFKSLCKCHFHSKTETCPPQSWCFLSCNPASSLGSGWLEPSLTWSRHHQNWPRRDDGGVENYLDFGCTTLEKKAWSLTVAPNLRRLSGDTQSNPTNRSTSSGSKKSGQSCSTSSYAVKLKGISLTSRSNKPCNSESFHWCRLWGVRCSPCQRWRVDCQTSTEGSC